jgi:hypothetical protein
MACSPKEATTMNEQITKIVEVQNDQVGWDGFEVETTTQKIRLVICNYQDCCESWGYFWMNDKPEDFIGAELLGVEVVDAALNKQVLDKEVGSLDEGLVMFVNLNTSVGVLQFTAYNCHNGYYSHTAKVECEQLKYETYL